MKTMWKIFRLIIGHPNIFSSKSSTSGNGVILELKVNGNSGTCEATATLPNGEILWLKHAQYPNSRLRSAVNSLAEGITP